MKIDIVIIAIDAVGYSLICKSIADFTDFCTAEFLPREDLKPAFTRHISLSGTLICTLMAAFRF